MKRKADYAFWTFVTLSAFAGLTTVFNVTRTYSATTGNSEIYKQLDLFGDVLERVRNDYVEKPDDTKLIETAINGMLSSLDPHSAYLNAKHFSDMQVQTKGEFGGLGIEVTMEEKVVKVVSPIDDTPAARAGVMANDLITHLDNEPIVGLTLEQAVEKMRGKVGTPITLTIQRKGREEPLEIKLTRAVIKINAVRSRAEGDIAYVKISTFNEQTHANLVSQLERLKKQIVPGIKGYVVDLRNNPGGLLDQAISLTDDFLERGVIVLTKGRNLEETQRANARAGDITDGKRIIVLVNGGSASASEIVAGALQDHDRALVIGTRSFGKGSVQTIIPLGTQLNRAGAIRLTTARYFTPSGRSIQAKGIDPDVVVEQELPEELKAKASKERPRGEASLRGHLKGEGEKEKEESGSNSYVPTDAEKDTQLQYALKLIRGELPEPPARVKEAPVPIETPKAKK